MSKSSKLTLVLLGLGIGLLLGAGATALVIQFQAAQTRQALVSADIPFLQHMNLHHDQALTLSQIMQSKVSDQPLDARTLSIGALARSIESSQRLEMGMFRGWLMQWEQPLLPQSVNMEWMLPMANEEELAFISRCKAAGGGMEGMASMDQINRLSDAKLPDASEQFLDLMQKHHEAALPMLAYAARNASDPQVKQLAAAMWSDQRKELLMIQSLKAR